MNKLNNKIENKFSMYKVVLNLLQINPALVGLHLGIQNLADELKVMVAGLGSLMQQKLQITTGLSKDKMKAKWSLINMARVVGGAVCSYAYELGNNELMYKVKHAKSDLLRARDEELIDICRNYYDLGNTYLANITPYGVDAMLLQTFLVMTDLFAAKSPQPTEAREHTATLNKEIKRVDKEVSLFLKNRLDRVITILEPNDTIFVNDYFNTRKIIDLGTRHQKAVVVPLNPDAFAYMTGTITDINGEPVEDALVEVIGENGTYTDVTDEDGIYFVEGIADGTYDVRVSYEGKQHIDVFDVVFNADDEVENDFTMEDDVVPTPEA